MTEIKVLKNDIERALRTLKRRVQLDGVLGKLRDRGKGWKPSIRRKTKEAIAKRRRIRRERRLRSI